MPSQPCDDQRLSLLHAGDDTPAGRVPTSLHAEHVETCPRCQSRLAELWPPATTSGTKPASCWRSIRRDDAAEERRERYRRERLPAIAQAAAWTEAMARQLSLRRRTRKCSAASAATKSNG